jgi:hypothetical protein
MVSAVRFQSTMMLRSSIEMTASFAVSMSWRVRRLASSRARLAPSSEREAVEFAAGSVSTPMPRMLRNIGNLRALAGVK